MASVLAVGTTAENHLVAEQRSDSDFKLIITYLETGMLPDDDSEARKVALHSEAFDLRDGVLYHECANTPYVVFSGSTEQEGDVDSRGSRW